MMLPVLNFRVAGWAVTSLEKESGKKVNMEEAKEKVKRHLADLFEMRLISRNNELIPIKY